MSKLRALIAIAAGGVLATGIAGLQAQASRTRADTSSATSTITYESWQSQAGAKDYMNTDDKDGGTVSVVPNSYDAWIATGCETLENPLTGTNTIFCKQEDSDYKGSQPLCLSAYNVQLNDPLVLMDCNAEGNGRQYDMLWWYGTGLDAGLLENQGTGNLAVTQGSSNDPVNLGSYTGDPNNKWTLSTF